MNIRAKIFGGAEADESLLRPKKPKGAKADTLHSIAVAREARRLSNGRAEDRHRLSGERARITHDGADDVEVELINLSGGGAMVSGPFEPMMWDRVNLHLGNHGTIECAVRWIRDGRVGLEFAHETRLDCSADEMATLLRYVIERTFPHIAFPERQKEETAEGQVDGLDEEGIDEGRSASRHPLIWNGTLHHDFQSDPIRIRNISSSGAMIETTTVVRVGSEPLLELSDAVSVSATVEWVVGDQIGLRFHSPFDMSLLAESRPVVVQSDWTPPEYLNQADDADQGHWQRLSLIELREELEGFLKY